MKILVIGGTGHVGNYLVDKLLAKGHDVYVGARGEVMPRDKSAINRAKFIPILPCVKTAFLFTGL